MSVDSTLQRQYGLSRSSGALIAVVGPGTPAARAGLQQGDIITDLHGKAMTSETDMSSGYPGTIQTQGFPHQPPN